jgi:hypothetical protein
VEVVGADFSALVEREDGAIEAVNYYPSAALLGKGNFSAAVSGPPSELMPRDSRWI